MIRDILEKATSGEISLEEAERRLRMLCIEEVEGLAKLDVNRDIRKGIPEVVFAEGKEVEELKKIVEHMLESSGRALVSRVSDEQIEALEKAAFPHSTIEVDKKARFTIIKRRSFKQQQTGGKVGVITAGTSDIPTAQQAKIIAEEMGCQVYTAHDVGVAGIHRVFPSLMEMLKQDVDALVVVAGMEGALPSIVAGLVDLPVIGVPTSQGYGLGGGGKGALVTMLQSCSLGITVVNIDNGLAAGAAAALIATRAGRVRLEKKSS